jgi:adenylate cyclase
MRPLSKRKRAIRFYPHFRPIYRGLAAALGELGRVDEAKEALAEAAANRGPLLDMYVRQRRPWMRQEDYAHLLEGLRKSGWPH